MILKCKNKKVFMIYDVKFDNVQLKDFDLDECVTNSYMSSYYIELYMNLTWYIKIDVIFQKNVLQNRWCLIIVKKFTNKGFKIYIMQQCRK